MSHVLRCWARAIVASVLAVLVGCGGGGGAGNGMGAGDSDHGDFRFASSIEQASIDGIETPFDVAVQPDGPMASSVYFKPVDDAGVLVADPHGIWSPGGSAFTLTLNVTATAAPGVHTGTVQILAYDDESMTKVHPGSPWTIPYRVTVHPRHNEHRIEAETLGVGLSQVPGWSRLTRTVTISDNLGQATAWQASSDRTWLSVTPSGITGTSGNLTISADTKGLEANALHTATVTVISGEPGVTNSESIRVALWVGSATPVQAAPDRQYESVRHILADPAAPWIYLGGVTRIRIKNAYTGADEGVIESGVEDLGAMTISDDGSRLFAIDQQANQILVFDTASRKRIATWSLPTRPAVPGPIQYLRTNGVGVLLAHTGDALSATDGALLLSIPMERAGAMTVSADRKFLYVNESITASVTKFAVDWSDSLGGRFIVRDLGHMFTDGESNANGRDVAVTPDGQRVFSVSGGLYAVTEFDANSLQYIGTLNGGGEARPTAVEAAVDGRMYSCTGNSVKTYSQRGALLASTFLFDSVYEACGNGLAVTADGAIVAVSPSGADVMLLPMGQ